jgi:hypothetical protein
VSAYVRVRCAYRVNVVEVEEGGGKSFGWISSKNGVEDLKIEKEGGLMSKSDEA